MGHLGQPAKRLMGLLGLFLTSRLSLCSCRRRTLPAAAEAPLLCGSLAPWKKGVLLSYSGGRWGSCPTLRYGKLRLCL